MEDSILKKFIKYVSLNVLGMIGHSLYILADTYFISKALGATGLAALNFAISLFSFITATGLMIGIGGATRYILLRSRNKIKKSNISYTTSIKIGVLIGFVFLVLGQLFSKEFSLLLGADETTLADTSIYIKMIFTFAPFFITNHILNAFVRNDNAPKLATIAMLTGSFSNIIIDYIFMFPLNMGMFGAVFATCLAPIISLIILSSHFINKNNNFEYIKNKLNIKEIKKILSLGISSFINEFSSGLVLITFNLVILQLSGNIGVAAYGVVANLALIVAAIFTGVAQGIQPLISRSYALDNNKNYKSIIKYSIVTSFSLSILIYFLSFKYSKEVISIFNSENNKRLLEIADIGLKIYFIGFFFTGVNIISTSVLSARERAREGFLISILRGFVLIVPIVIILSKLHGMNGVWISYVISELIVFIILIILNSKRSIISI